MGTLTLHSSVGNGSELDRRCEKDGREDGYDLRGDESGVTDGPTTGWGDNPEGEWRIPESADVGRDHDSSRESRVDWGEDIQDRFSFHGKDVVSNRSN